MLPIEIPGGEFWDSERNVFVTTKPVKLRLEHSLISLTRWEEKYKRPYLSKTQGPRTVEETLYYFYCMSLDQNVPLYIFQRLTSEQYQEILDYINDSHTATTIKPRPPKKGAAKPPIMTSEVIYAYMAEFNLPFSVCEKWHLNHLLMLIQVCSEQNAPTEKVPKGQVWKDYAKINAANRAKFHTKG